VASIAKKDLKPGDVLDGEGGYTVFGRLMTSQESVRNRYLPMGLSRGARMIKTLPKDSFVTYHDVEMDEDTFAFRVRKTLEEGSRRPTP